MPEETIIKIQDNEELVSCDYGHTFKTKNSLLIPYKAEVGALLCIDNTYVAKRFAQAYADLEGTLLACPVCKVVHLSGFNKANTVHAVAGEDNHVPERKLSPEL